MMNCREATRLLSERQERPLGLREQLSLRVHLLLCHLCREFGKLVGSLSTQAHHYGQEDDVDNSSEWKLSAESKERMQRGLEDQPP